MATKSVTCIVLSCDECGVAAFDDNNSEHACALHFDTTGEAYGIANQEGWYARDGRALCRSCVERASCAQLGHDWPEWWHDVCTSHYVGRVRWCRHCGVADHDPPLAAG